jgi:cytochrome c oxidase subunit III
MYWVGHIATLVSIFALFGTLMVAYIWRSGNPQFWHPVTLPRQLWLSTALLLSCSAAIETARWCLRQRGLDDYAAWLRRTGWLALAFLVSQALCWRIMENSSSAIAGDQNRGLFYILTGAHAFHILGGIAVIGYLMWRVRNPWLTDGDLRRHAITFMLATYWHFMGAIWLALYALFALTQPQA